MGSELKESLSGLLEDSELAEDEPENDEDENAKAATAAAELFSAISGGDGTKDFAH